MDTIRVASDSRVQAVAGSIAKAVRAHGKVNVRAIGAGAVHQAAKAIAVARRYLEQEGIGVACVPSFSDVEIGGQRRTAIDLEVLTLPGTPALPRAAGGTVGRARVRLTSSASADPER